MIESVWKYPTRKHGFPVFLRFFPVNRGLSGNFDREGFAPDCPLRRRSFLFISSGPPMGSSTLSSASFLLRWSMGDFPKRRANQSLCGPTMGWQGSAHRGGRGPPRHRRSPRLPGPEEPEPLPVPTYDGFGLDDDQRRAPARLQARVDDPENPIDHPKRWPGPFPPRDSHLLAESEYLCVECRAARKGLADDGEEGFDRLMHAGEDIRRWAEIPRFPQRME